MRGVCFHFLELLTVLHNLCLDCRNRPHFRDKFSAKKNVYIREHTNYSISGYYVYRDVKDAIPHNSFFGIPKFIGSSTFIGTSAPRHLGVLRKDAVPYSSLIVIPKIIGTSTFIGTSGTPSPTFRLSGYRRLSERQRLSGRQHLVASACSARTPSPTFRLS